MSSRAASIAGWSRGAAAICIMGIMGIILLVTVPFSAPVSGQLQTLDLRLHTAGVEGPQIDRRSFTAANDVRVITVRYRFQTNEVPGGWFGSQFNDSFSVAIRGSSGSSSVETNSMNELGLGAFNLLTGTTAWREVSLSILPNEVITVELEVSNVEDNLFDSTLLVDLIDQVTMEISEAETKLFDIDESPHTDHEPLNFLSAKQPHPYFGGVTRIGGTIRVTGAPTDRLAEVSLEVLQGTAVVATAQLTQALRAQLLTEFGEDGAIAVSTRQRMFDLQGPNNIDVGQNSTVTLQVVARAASGEVRSRVVATGVRVLTRYTGDCQPEPCFASNLFSHRDLAQGGDDWARPSTKQLADYFRTGNEYNDFSNMHAGMFGDPDPTGRHTSHKTGNDIDGRFVGYSAMNAATAQTIIAQLNSVMGNRIGKVLVSQKEAPEFWAAIDVAGLRAKVQAWPGHRRHYHWHVPDFAGAAAEPASAPSGGRQP